MTYRGYHIITEVPTYGQYEIDENGNLKELIQYLYGDVTDGIIWYVVQDKERCYVESLSSFEEAKAYVNYLIDAPDGAVFTFEPVEVAA